MHISALSTKFVKDPHSAVKAGNVDSATKPRRTATPAAAPAGRRSNAPPPKREAAPQNNAMAAALAKLKR